MGTRRDSRVLVEFGHAIAAHDGGTMENTPNNTNPKSDVLQSDHHSAMTAEQIAKAQLRHNREHKGDGDKAVQQEAAKGKKK